MTRSDSLGFFGRNGYALAALGALTWAANALQDQDSPDARCARAWVLGEPASAGSLSFDLCVQAVGMSSRKQELRETMVGNPGELMARLLLMGRLMRNEDEGVPGDLMESLVRMQRAIHLEGATTGAPMLRPQQASEQAC